MIDRIKELFAFEVLYASVEEYNFGRVGRMSAAVAYRTLFALAPILIISIGLLGAVLGSDVEAQMAIIDGLTTIFGDEVGTALATFIGTALAGSSGATIVGLVLLLWTTSSLFYEVQNDLNDIFHVPYEETAGAIEFIKKRGWGFVWAFGIGVMVLTVWLSNVIWTHFDDWFEDRNLEVFHTIIDALAPLASLIFLPVLFALLYQSLSDVKILRRPLIYGALLVAVAYVVTGWGAGLYFKWSGDTSAATVAGSLFVIILLAYILSGVFLFGGVVIKVYQDYLVHGDVLSPTDRRANEIADAIAAEVVVASPPTPVPVGAISGFLAGLFVGWRRSRD